MRWLLLLLAIGCSSNPLSDPCSEASIAARLAPVVAECNLRKQTECNGYAVLDECPLASECDARIDRVGANCHD